ncbi:multicopper oxidase-domain-containing protein [Penicillium riverlandense]|uniref:multicopper oxidase-domain-containing protein n=1 Tax=Penicillium riverlandense TaxID=1903569 RepID=UPI002549A929|nr:multicopper oxidase-domain-containing protein [Penicillium riverlandense]KAJ5818171.1 multicopper oxidase-domain-containing protein [Penicillium riverlandense]
MRTFLSLSPLLLPIFSSRSIAVVPCQNTPTSRGCWGEHNISTDYYAVTPDTGVIREYWLSVQNCTLAPDGYERQVLVFNGSYPGPTIEADWGDTLIIHVRNELTDNGTAIHWHGVRQHGTNEHDGTPGITQCPIAPGDKMTYKFRATQYGTSWYHSHWSLQLADGLYGPIVIHGPATANYDVDLGPVVITDWYHQSAFKLWTEKTMYGGFPVRSNAIAANGLINGTNTYPCEDSNDPSCLGTGQHSETVIQKGKRYLIRLIDAEIDGWMKFTIDRHKLTVIAADFVPIEPYQTDSVIITSGQRYDIVIEADQGIGSYWMRAIFQTACNEQEIERNDIRGIIRYESATDEGNPTSKKWPTITDSCGDEPYESLVPYVAKDVGSADHKENLDIGWFYETDLVYHWAINTKALDIDWQRPTNLMIYHNESVFPTEYNVYEIPSDNEWTYWVIQDLGLVDAYHPFHLHGHDFYILAQGIGLYTDLTVRLNRNNPPRRDTATMAGSGYLVIAFKNDNPGSWLMHCHIAWHSSQSLALQFVERQSEIPKLVGLVSDNFETICENWKAYYKSAIYTQDDSGV